MLLNRGRRRFITSKHVGREGKKKKKDLEIEILKWQNLSAQISKVRLFMCKSKKKIKWKGRKCEHLYFYDQVDRYYIYRKT